MFNPLGPVSDPVVEDSPLNGPSTSPEFANVLTDTFTAWLEDLKPALEADKDIVPAVEDEPPVGELRFEGTLRVDCYVTGRLRSLTGTLFVSETGEIESEIFVATAIIDGVMHGDIHATERVELQSHARVFGYIESPALAIQPGAVFAGQCDFLPLPFESDVVDSNGGENRMTSPDHSSFTQSQDFPSVEGSEQTEGSEPAFAAVAAVS